MTARHADTALEGKKVGVRVQWSLETYIAYT
jgi:hypothetical protein